MKKNDLHTAPAFGEEIGFERRRGIVRLRMPRNAVGRQAFPHAGSSE
jgi:hypothetical protein